MGLILDTSILIAFERRSIDLDRFIQGRHHESVGISVITAAELLHGVYRADSPKRRLTRSAFVEKVIEQVPVYPFDLAAARIYAELWAQLQKKGIQVGSHDLVVGATSLSLGFSVATLNLRDYEKIDGLTLEHVTESR